MAQSAHSAGTCIYSFMIDVLITIIKSYFDLNLFMKIRFLFDYILLPIVCFAFFVSVYELRIILILRFIIALQNYNCIANNNIN